MKLSGRHYEKLANALLFAFPTIEHLEQMVRFRLDINLHMLGYGDLNNYVFKLIQWAEANGKLDMLVNGARQSNPNNSDLFDVAQELNLATSNAPSKFELQRIVREANSFLNVNEWRTKLSVVEFQVCRIEIKLEDQNIKYGTGFLIAPDVLITNYHVMSCVIENELLKRENKIWADVKNVTLRFDFKTFGSDHKINFGTEYHLAPDNWLIDASPINANNEKNNVGDLPEEDQLDYALLRIHGAPGDEAIGISEPGASKRGWIKLPLEPYNFPIDSPLIIVQHPSAGPLKLAIDTQGIIGLNKNGTRVKYRTNTESGSSGSPCFNINWELIALHHLGDPNYSFGYSPTYNQGIPISAICELLKKRNLLDKIQN